MFFNVFALVLCHIGAITPSAVLAQCRFVATAQDACPGRKVHAQGTGFVPWAEDSCLGHRIRAQGYELARVASRPTIPACLNGALANQNGVLASQNGV